MMEQRRKECLANFFFKKIEHYSKKDWVNVGMRTGRWVGRAESVVHVRWCVEHKRQMELVG
jgi:hypothetical protein